ncbi:MAG TPA: NAD(P)/FAD-dependent oxidoreductase [Myxococcota bacterium]|nr:NAD(P)/FAD-dependent oxidoreductase [Myxococcota bacterium]
MVVGAGPVGLATAIAARLHGIACIVIDRREPPCDKACGEGILPHGVRYLAELGVTPPIAHPFVGIRYVDGQRTVAATFPEPALGVRRTVLFDSMRRRAEELGCDVRFGVSATGLRQERDHAVLETSDGDLAARLVVGADGLHSKIRDLAGIEVRPGPYPRYAARRHYAIRPWSEHVDVHWHDACEAYVTPVANNCVGVAIISHGKLVSFDEALDRFPQLAARLAHAEIVSPLRGAGPFHQRVERRHLGHVALVGDAAGYVDALTGEGLSIGFGCALALADVIARGQPLATYEDHYRRLTRGYYRTTGMMLALARKPALRRQAINVLSRTPRLFAALLAKHAGYPTTRNTWLGRKSSSSISRLVGTR